MEATTRVLLERWLAIEDGDELRRTLTGIAANLPGLLREGLHWSEVAVCVVMDGRERVSASMLDYVAMELQLYDPTLLTLVHGGKPVTVRLGLRTGASSRAVLGSALHVGRAAPPPPHPPLSRCTSLSEQSS